MSERDTLPRVSTSVRELVEFVLMSGSLERGVWVGESALVAAWEGTRGHQEIQASRPSSYQAEVPLSLDVPCSDHILHLRGRVDGIMHTEESATIEEIKTHIAFHELSPSPVHWAQGKVYAYIYLQQHPLSAMDIQLTYYHRKTREIQIFRETFSRDTLTVFFHQLIEEYSTWTSQQLRWEQRRNQSIQALNFPYPAYREGQRHLAVATYRAIADNQVLFAEAPTGIGKTMAIVFPAVKALQQGIVDTIFYLTAKTVGRWVAEKSLADMRSQGLHLRSVTLTAKEKICATNGEPCQEQECPFAVGYYDRLKPALQAGLHCEALDLETIQSLARQHQLCPFEFSLDLALWADVVICDYNYVFDPKVYLRRFFEQRKTRYTFLIDEAHNFVDRVRSMFSASLTKRMILDAKNEIRESFPTCIKPLHAIQRYLVQLRKDVESAGDSAPYPGAWVDTAKPEPLLKLLENLLDKVEETLARTPGVLIPPTFLELFFAARDFLRISQVYSPEHFVTYYVAERQQEQISLYCLDPSVLVQQRLKRGKSAVLFSATLRPMEYYRQMLGHTEDSPVLSLPSPFPPENLRIKINAAIETNYRSRNKTYDDVVTSIASMVHGPVGNYMVFFPSYAYLGEVYSRFLEQHPHIPTLVQTPGMTEHERAVFLDMFSPRPTTALLGFVVMGGIFGEGIDLVGERLRGVIIVGVGLPQVCLERNLIRDHFDKKTGTGFLFAYTYPGMNKVLQAVGRLIRSETDTGEALLIDKRFAQRTYSNLFPPWWSPQRFDPMSHHSVSPVPILQEERS